MTKTTPQPPTPLAPTTSKLLAFVADKARAAGVFGEVTLDGGTLRCQAKASAEPAEYRLFVESGVLWVSLVTEARWLSQSIEADLIHTGDKIDELVQDELVDLGWEGFRPTFEHFRDPQKLYTFRTRLTPPLDLAKADAVDTMHKAAVALLAYEQAFRELGDMEADDEE